MTTSSGATTGRRRRRTTAVSVTVALLAGGVLLFEAPRSGPTQAKADRVSIAAAWPNAQRADLQDLPQGLEPGLFLDANTVVGIAASPDGAFLRLLLRTADGKARELRRLSVGDDPRFASFTASGGEVLWTESSRGRNLEIWAVTVSGNAPARRLTADSGSAVFYGNQFDLVVADGKVHWIAGASDGADGTQIRSVGLRGGQVGVRTLAGNWVLAAWPWVIDEFSNPAGTSRLRNLRTGGTVEVAVTPGELINCSASWCRVMVMNGDGLTRVDLMRPDGTGRRRIAGSNVRAALPDVAVLDRFEVLSEVGPNSDLTGTDGLLVYDIVTGQTVHLSPAVKASFSRGGVLWWSTGDLKSPVWHTLDLRTV